MERVKIQLCLIIFGLLTSCNQSYLSVHTDYFSRESLASFYVGTPDPRLDNPPIGQRLIISWSIPKLIFKCDDLHLKLKIRFRNREELIERIAICRAHGHYLYTLLNEEYMSKRGILTYTVDLIRDGEIIEEWRHQIWTDLIDLSQETKENSINAPFLEEDEDF